MAGRLKNAAIGMGWAAIAILVTVVGLCVFFWASEGWNWVSEHYGNVGLRVVVVVLVLLVGAVLGFIDEVDEGWL